MKQSTISLAGFSLIAAAFTFWLSWFLMPDQGTADTMHILAIVSRSRHLVLTSVIIQIASSVLYILALFCLVKQWNASGKTAFLGIVLLAIGAMGMCADAFFHLLAFFMTDGSVEVERNVIQVMTLMQSKGLLLLLPLLLPFFVGTLFVALGLYKQRIISKLPLTVIICAFLIGITGAVLVNKVLGYGRPALVLLVLGLFALGQIIIGKELLKLNSEKKSKILRTTATI